MFRIWKDCGDADKANDRVIMVMALIMLVMMLATAKSVRNPLKVSYSLWWRGRWPRLPAAQYICQ